MQSEQGLNKKCKEVQYHAQRNYNLLILLYSYHVPLNAYTCCTLMHQVQAFTVYTLIFEAYAYFPTHMSICGFA